MAVNDETVPFHEMGLDDRLLKVSSGGEVTDLHVGCVICGILAGYSTFRMGHTHFDPGNYSFAVRDNVIS